MKTRVDINILTGVSFLTLSLLIYCVSLPDARAAKTTRSKKPEPTPTATATPEPYLKQFEVYCPINEIKFSNLFWDSILKVTEEFKVLVDPCITIRGFTSLETGIEQDRHLARERADWVKKCLLAEDIPLVSIYPVETADPIMIDASMTDRDRLKANRVEIILKPCDPDRPIQQREFEMDPNDPFRIIVK